MLPPAHEAVLQQHPPGSLRQTHGGQPPDSAVVALSVHVSAGRLLWFSDGGTAGQQTREVKLLFLTPYLSLTCRFTTDLRCIHPFCLRKGTLLFNNIFSIVPAVMMGCSEIAKSFEIIIVARFIVGICAGWVTLILI